MSSASIRLLQLYSAYVRRISRTGCEISQGERSGSQCGEPTGDDRLTQHGKYLVIQLQLPTSVQGDRVRTRPCGNVCTMAVGH